MQRPRWLLLLIIAFWSLSLSAQNSGKLADGSQKNADLHPLGFPTYSNPVATADVKASVVFLSNDSLVLYFEQQVSGTTQLTCLA